MISVADHVIDMGLGAGEHGGRVVFAGTLDALKVEPRSLTAKYMRGELGIADTGDAAARTAAADQADRRARAQSEGHRRRGAAQHAHRRHRRERLGQVDARARRALCGDEARQGRLGSQGRRAPAARGPRVRERRGAGRSGADRADAAVEPGDLPQGVRSDPRALRGDQGREVARAHGEPLLVQRAGRTLRGVPGRRRSARRDAVPRGRVRPVRAVRRPPLQAAGARSRVSRQDRSRRCST